MRFMRGRSFFHPRERVVRVPVSLGVVGIRFQRTDAHVPVASQVPVVLQSEMPARGGAEALLIREFAAGDGVSPLR